MPSNDVFVKGTLPSNDVFVKGTINKYKDLSIPLIICTLPSNDVFVKGTRICMENEIDFKSNLIKDMENFVRNFDLKTIINIY